MLNTLWNSIFCAVFTWWTICHKRQGCVAAETNIIVEAPVNPVNEGGILSIYCQLSNIEEGYTVQIFRTIQEATPTMLSIGETILLSGDERMFIAVRQLSDGTYVYLLSIMDATSNDGGLYQCKVVSTYEVTQVAEGSVEINFVYFPNVSPVCAGETQFQEGIKTKLTCNSDKGNPPVSVEWERSGSGSMDIKTEKYVVGSRIFVDLYFIPTRNLNNAVFTCKVTSDSFPGKLETCHIGPVSIIPKSSPLIPNDQLSITTTIGTAHREDEESAVSASDITHRSRKCNDVCMKITSSKSMFWIVTTVIAVIVAILFCIIVIALIIKYHSLTLTFETDEYNVSRRHVSEIYDELSMHGADRERCKMYMSLESCKNREGLCEQNPEER